MAENIERELGWDDEITEDQKEFVVLPAGDYDFVVTAFERGRHEPRYDDEGNRIGKLPACPKAILTLEFTNPDDIDNPAIIKHNLFLHTTTEGMISAFLVGIGQKKHGESVKPRWNEAVGSKGRAKLTVREFTMKNGEIGHSNDIKKFYEPNNKTATKFTPGAF